MGGHRERGAAAYLVARQGVACRCTGGPGGTAGTSVAGTSVDPAARIDRSRGAGARPALWLSESQGRCGFQANRLRAPGRDRALRTCPAPCALPAKAHARIVGTANRTGSGPWHSPQDGSSAPHIRTAPEKCNGQERPMPAWMPCGRHHTRETGVVGHPRHPGMRVGVSTQSPMASTRYCWLHLRTKSAYGHGLLSEQDTGTLHVRDYWSQDGVGGMDKCVCSGPDRNGSQGRIYRHIGGNRRQILQCFRLEGSGFMRAGQ